MKKKIWNWSSNCGCENIFNIQNGKIFLFNTLIFILFSFFLVAKNVYSIIALLIFLFCLSTVPLWRLACRDAKTRWFIYYFLAVGLFWSISFDGWWSWSAEGDLPAKYALAGFCVLGTCSIRIYPRALIYAFALGSILACGLAIAQFMEVGKATGYTNAIRFGDIAILMGIFCLAFSVVRQLTIGERLFLLLSGCMGVAASLLSLSRGGWPLLLVAPLVFFLGFYKEKLTKARLGIAVITVAVVAALGWFAAKDLTALNQRVTQATEEVRGYFADREKYVGTSVGARLEQWRMSWSLGLEKPITGWGDHGVWDGRKQFVQRGEADPSALQIAHTHNEFLEMWARRGLVGVICLALIYLVPFYIFIPRSNAASDGKDMLYRALHVAGMMVPVGYFIFGLSEVFFFLNIGNIFYIFSLVLLFSAIKWIERDGGLQ